MSNTVKLTESGKRASLDRDILFDLQLRVARRSDALAQACTGTPTCDLALWLRAEQDIFETVDWADVSPDSGLGVVPPASARTEAIDSSRAIMAGCGRLVGAEGESETLDAAPSNCHSCDRLV